MALLSIRNLRFSFGGRPLLEDVTLQVEQGERLGLLGRNGAGKSTLMRLISGELEADAGEIIRQPGLRIARLIQEVPPGQQGTVYDVVSDGLAETGELLRVHHNLAHELAANPSDSVSRKLDEVQHELEATGGWQAHQQVEKVISQTGLDPDAPFTNLSSGMKRRVLLAKSLANAPDILLLDEPTNHLDITTIDWLEDFLKRLGATLVFVTHDRVFLQRLATRILDIDRARLTSWDCDYQTYLRRKEASLDAEAQQHALFDKKLAQEEVWIRTGIKARRTRNEGRVRALERMRDERAQRRQKVGNVRMQTQAAEKTGRLVIEAKNISFVYGDTPVFKDFSALISRDDRIGIIGPNGAGKTTLLRNLLGDLEPTTGSIRHGTNLQVAYFDQLRGQLDEQQTVQENVGDGSDHLEINGQRKHVLGYLQDFLFSPERARMAVANLSGGEKNRAMLAKLFTRPANVLVLDEPTNDLDMETLELLEELLLDYKGTVLLVSHDRAFLNNVVTSCFVFEGDAVLKEYAGGYDDWLRQRSETEQESPAERTEAEREASVAVAPTPKKRKLSYKDERELAVLPKRIEELETRQGELHALMAGGEFYKQPGETIVAIRTELETLEAELLTAFDRWEELEG
ncbi:MAG: ABC transporter ATP-binding protein [Planctomycetaceae bacterium]|nr:ABC transporter ATP-binding protein [Planctomycetaceae bacterium]